MTLTAWIPSLRPPHCPVQQQAQCIGPNSVQLGVLLLGLVLLSIGIDSISWVLGFGIPTILMFGSIILFFLGTKLYVYLKPKGSICSFIAQVFVAAYKKRHLELPNDSKGWFEHKRRALANSNYNAVEPPLVLWLSPQLILLGFAKAFNLIRQIELYNQQFPENMRSIATSLFYCTAAGANYLSSLVVSLVHGLTGRNGKLDWLTNDINQGRVDYFYYLLVGLGVINLVYFVLCARNYRYKSVEIEQGKPYLDLELNLVKH
ncbi:hypothetical protein Ancab_020641 [Ancistrocladus abbreviatus]